MTQPSEQPNPLLTEASSLVQKTLAGGKEAPYCFKELAQMLLSKTILADGQAVAVHAGNNRYILSGRRRQDPSTAAEGREFFEPLWLTNRNYLYVFYDNFLDQADHDYLKTLMTKISYQLDFDGHKQLFRFDHNRHPENKYPHAHLHVYGSWTHTSTVKALQKIHFPVIRPTIEGVIRLLVNEFEVPTNSDETLWAPMLDHTEAEFLKVAGTMRKKTIPDG